MEKIVCDTHGSLCLLKTGTKDGPNKGKSFYVCVQPGCKFLELASVPTSHCLLHEDSMVELQSLAYIQQKQSYGLFYRCVEGKKLNKKWCGNVPWNQPQKEKENAEHYVRDQPSSPSRHRNPFMFRQCDGGDVKDHYVPHCVEVSVPKVNVERSETVEEGRRNSSEADKGRQLPLGMKIKKKAPVEEGNSPKATSGDKMPDKVQDEARGKHTGQEKAEKHLIKAVSPKKTNQTSKDAKSSPSGSTQASLNPDNSKQPTSSKPSQSPEASQTKNHQEDDDDDDEVVLVSVKPATQKVTPPASTVQKSLTAFPGFQPVSKANVQQGNPKGLYDMFTAQLQQKKATLAMVNVAALPDKGERLRTQVKELEDALESLSLTVSSQEEPQGACSGEASPGSSQGLPFSRQGGTILLPAPPAPGSSQQHASGSSLGLQPSQHHTHMHTGSQQVQATSKAIDHLHKSLESCPDPEAEAADPKGIKVSLLAHQKRALAWLLWRETQNPCGGILADDMGLGKTLTMIALILTKKAEAKEEDEETGKKKLEGWISKSDSSLRVSKGTLIVCPASLIHHWQREIERHVKKAKLSVYLYHGPNREKSAKVLADYDVVVTTYSLVSKEVPVQKGADKSSTDAEDVVGPKPPRSAPLLRVSWARVVLDEAHNIKNPKVQTSLAVCQLKACARWAVTGTPIQNNLLDMFSLLKFLRCSPFDELRLWKSQVDNGSKRGRERLNILTRSLLLRRCKDQLDSTGKPLVSLPNRTCQVHQLKLSQDEQAVYDVVFAQSRSTLQNYLQRHEGKDVNKGSTSSSNPFNKVAEEFGMSQASSSTSSSQLPQQGSSAIHILSLLLRLRQSCCHLSLLKKTLDSSELQGDGIVLSLEEQLNALSLSSSPEPSGPELKDTVALNGTRFPSKLFEETSESSKISAIISELKAIREKGDQKSVVVSQWTSMLHIVAVHLQRMGLKYAVIDGTVNPKRRMDLVEEFNTNPKGPLVMLVSLCAGGVGLNLIGGNHLFLMDMHWNPALEDQACDRIYRVGQEKDVTIHRFECEGTVEEKISRLQQEKKKLAHNVLSGTGNTLSKLSLADLRIIFGV